MEEERDKGQETRDKGQEPRDKGQETRDKGQEPRDKSQETRDKGQEPRDKSQETRDMGQEPRVKSQETRDMGQETRVKSQENLDEDIIYELSEGCESGDMESSPSGLRPDNPDNPETRLRRMIEEVGAETLLEIIRDNRNAAIRQIISEVEASQDHALQSGVSAARACNSIFDLAALA